MQGAALPIKLSEVFKLTNIGLNPDLFKFGNLTLESEKYICVKDGTVSSFDILIKIRWILNHQLLADWYLMKILGLRYHWLKQRIRCWQKAYEGWCYPYAQN